MTASTAQDAPPRAVLTEAAIQRGITDLLKRLGFTVYHTRFALGSDSGFPDIVACDDDGYLIAIECKGPRGKLRPGQRAWIDRLGNSSQCLFSSVVGPTETAEWMAYDDALWCIEQVAQEDRVRSA